MLVGCKGWIHKFTALAPFASLLLNSKVYLKMFAKTCIFLVVIQFSLTAVCIHPLIKRYFELKCILYFFHSTTCCSIFLCILKNFLWEINAILCSTSTCLSRIEQRIFYLLQKHRLIQFYFPISLHCGLPKFEIKLP